MEVEVSTILFPRFECKLLAGIDIITHFSMNFEIFR